MTDAISRDTVVSILKERQEYYAEKNDGKRMFAIANVIQDILNLPSIDSSWRTGKPTENGVYLFQMKNGAFLVGHLFDDEIAVGGNIYDFNKFFYRAWQKISPPQEYDTLATTKRYAV